MVIQRLNPTTIGLKLASTSVQIKQDGMIRIGDRDLEGPGEYDIAGVGVQVFLGAALFFCENIRMSVFWQMNGALSQEDTTCDVLVPLFGDPKQITTLIKELDPRIVVLYDEVIAKQMELNGSERKYKTKRKK